MEENTQVETTEAPKKANEPIDYEVFAEAARKEMAEELGITQKEAEEDAEPESEEPVEPDEPKQADISIEQLKELAEKGDIEGALEALGFDAKAVKKSDFVALRHKERALREKIEAKQKEANEKLQAANARLAENEQVIAGVSQAYELLKNGDRIGFIEKLTGETWEDYVSAATVHASDPALARVKQLERQLEKQREAERISREEYERSQQSVAQQKAQQEWMSDLKSTLASSPDKRIATLATRDEYTQQVFRIQQAAYHATGRALSHEDAARELIKNIEHIAREFVPVEKEKPKAVKVSGRVSQPGSTREMTPEERWQYFANL